MNISEILEITPESLAQTQKNLLKKGLVNKLTTFTNFVKEERFEKAIDMLCPSSHGKPESGYLDCDDLLPGQGNDLGDVLSRLQELQEILTDKKQ